MKFLIVIAVIVQLSLADKIFTKVVQPPNDKLYPIFDLIATKMQEHNKIRYTWMAGILNGMLPEYKTFMETHNTKVYKEFYEASVQAFSTVEQFTKDHKNCRLRRAATVDVMTLSELTAGTADLKEFIKNFGKDKQFKDEEAKNVILDISKQFPDLIKNFIESLNEEEKQKSAQLCMYGEQILKATGRAEQFSAIESFMREAQYHKNLAEVTDENCKWDLINFDEFVIHVLNNSYYLETA